MLKKLENFEKGPEKDPKECPRCSGAGKRSDGKECDRCKGSGIIR